MCVCVYEILFVWILIFNNVVGHCCFVFLPWSPSFPTVFFWSGPQSRSYTSSTARMSTRLKLANQRSLSQKLMWTLWRESPLYQITNCEHYVRQESLKTCFHQMESEVINEESKAEKTEFISYSKNECSHGPKHLPLHFLVMWPCKLTLLLSFFA